MITKIIKVFVKMAIKKFGMLTIEQGLNAIIPFLGFLVPILEQILEHSDAIIKGAKLIKTVL